jgi:ribosomal protein L27
MKQLLREFLAKIWEASNKERYPAEIIDPNYTRGEVGSISYFHSIEARDDAIKRGTHKLLPGDTGKPSVPAFSTDDIVDPEDSPTQTSVPAFVGAEKFREDVPLGVQIDPSTELHQTLPEQPAEKVSTPVPQTISAPEIAKVSREVDEELSALSDGTLRPLAEGYADRDVSDRLSDDVYYAENPSVLPTRFVVPPEIRAALRAANIPERYIKLLERTLNSSKSVNSSAMVGIVAPGTNASRFGEVLTMVLLALPRERRADFVRAVSDAAAQGKGKTAAESSWIESSVGHASAFEATMDTRFGKGNWKVDGAAWGIREDIAGLGMDPSDAGKSTDVLIRVQVEGQGDAVGIRCSLKKDEGTSFLSLSLSNLRSTLLQYHPNPERGQQARTILEKLESVASAPSTPSEKEAQDKIKAELRELAKLPSETKLPTWDMAKDRLTRLVHKIEQETLDHAPPKLVEAFRLLDELGETQFKKNIEVFSGLLDELSDEDAAAIFGASGTAGKEAKAALDCMKQTGGDPVKLAACLSSKGIKAPDLTGAVHLAIQSIGEHYTKNKNKERAAIVEAKLEEIYDIGRNICNMYIESLMDTSTPGTLRGLVETMSQTFSIRSSLLGKQEVLVDGFYIDQESTRDVFGVETPEELEESLAIVDVDGNKVLVYRAKGSGEFIRIGNIQMRQKDRGTKTTIMLNVGASRQFMLCAAESGASVMARRGDGPDVGYTYHRETGKPAKKDHVWVEIGGTWTEVRDPLTAKHPETGVAAAEGKIWVSRPRVEGGKVVGYDTEEMDRTPQLAAVMRMRGKLKLDESMDFYTRKPRQLLLEFLRNILVEADEDPMLPYTDASGKPRTAKSSTLRQYAPDHPGRKAYDAWMASRKSQAKEEPSPQAKASSRVRAQKTPTDRPSSTEPDTSSWQANTAFEGLFTSSPQTIIRNGQNIEVRQVIDPKTNQPIDTDTDEGRARAVEVINTRLEQIDSEIKTAATLLGKKGKRGPAKDERQRIFKWLGNVGELAAMRELLMAGAETYLLPDSAVKNDMLVIRGDKERGLTMMEVSVKSSTGTAFGKLGANARSQLHSGVEGKEVQRGDPPAPYKASDAIDAELTTYTQFMRFMSEGHIRQGNVQNVNDENKFDQTMIAQFRADNNDVISQDEFMQARKLTSADIEAFKSSPLYEKLQNNPKISQEIKTLMEQTLERLTSMVNEGKDVRLSAMKEFLTDGLADIYEETNSVVSFESDLVGATFSGKNGLEGVTITPSGCMKQRAEDEYGDIAKMNPREQFKVLGNLRLGTRGLGRKKEDSGGYLGAIVNFAPPINLIQQNDRLSPANFIKYMDGGATGCKDNLSEQACG